jgi:RNA polymerase sigma-70 factor (ECF subfamily)
MPMDWTETSVFWKSVGFLFSIKTPVFLHYFLAVGNNRSIIIEQHCRGPPFLMCSLITETEENRMVEINLREYYPDFYTADVVIEVSDELAAQFRRWRLNEAAYRLRTYRHKAQYSLDCGDGIEYEAVFTSLSPCEIYEKKVTMEQLYVAIAKLSDKQAKRIYAHYFRGMSKADIARAEGVSTSTVKDAISRGLHNLEKILKSFQ